MATADCRGATFTNQVGVYSSVLVAPLCFPAVSVSQHYKTRNPITFIWPLPRILVACRFPVPVPAIHSQPIQCFNWRNFSEKRSDRHMYSGTVTRFRRNAVQLQHTIDNSIRFTYAMFFCSLSISPPTIHEHTRRQNILFRYPGFYRKRFISLYCVPVRRP